MKFRSRFFSGLSFALCASMSFWHLPSAQAITVVHTNDLLGEIEPCGCRNNPMGGMARNANFIKRLKDPSIIQLDAGDLLFPTEVIPEPLQKQSLLQAQYLLKAMDMTGHDAVVPGEKDFALGFEAFQKLTRKAKLKFVAANLKRRNGKEVFAPFVLLSRKDTNGQTVRIAVIGLVDPALSWPKELKASAPIPIARTQVAQLRKKADYVIALTHEGFEKDQALAKAVPGIDLIIGGHSQSFLQAPVVVGSTRIYQSSFRNQYIGAIPLKKPMKDDEYQLIGLDPAYESPAQAPSAMDDLVKEFKTAIAELNSREEARMTAASVAESHSASKMKFQTFSRCAECHLKQFDFWRKTAHANALTPLFEAKQAQNKECLSCHTVGAGDPQGWQFVTRLAEIRKDGQADEAMSLEDLHAYLKSVHKADHLDTPVKLTEKSSPVPLRQSLNAVARSFAPVQCENCHQPGQDHPFSNGYSKQVARETCLNCHTPERAPAWYKGKDPDWKLIDSKRSMITCPAGEPASE